MLRHHLSFELQVFKLKFFSSYSDVEYRYSVPCNIW
jgi:hypothetical protein